MRDDFSSSVKEQLAKRVGFRCSNPKCRQQTAGPKADESGAVNIGVAAHITAAAKQGPRYDATLAASDRKSTSNGIWLCQICQKLIDSDVSEYSEGLLRDWKEIAEATALLELKGLTAIPNDRAFLKDIEKQMLDFIVEMREDIKEDPLVREFILFKKAWAYNADPDEKFFTYFFDDHAQLRQKVQILESHDLVRNISYNNVERFRISEKLIKHLKSSL